MPICQHRCPPVSNGQPAGSYTCHLEEGHDGWHRAFGGHPFWASRASAFKPKGGWMVGDQLAVAFDGVLRSVTLGMGRLWSEGIGAGGILAPEDRADRWENDGSIVAVVLVDRPALPTEVGVAIMAKVARYPDEMVLVLDSDGVWYAVVLASCVHEAEIEKWWPMVVEER